MKISRHAYDRAIERLQWNEDFFHCWVDWSSPGWAKLGADYFRAHGCQVSGEDHNETLYRCPLTEHRAVCIVVADQTIVTVIPFDFLPGEGIFLSPGVCLEVPGKSKAMATDSGRKTKAEKFRKLRGRMRSRAKSISALLGQMGSDFQGFSVLLDQLGGPPEAGE